MRSVIEMIVQMHESYLSRLFQISDLAVSVTGNANNYPEELDTELFWKLYRINTNMSARGLTTTAPSDGGIGNPHTTNHPKIVPMKRRFGRFFR